MTRSNVSQVGAYDNQRVIKSNAYRTSFFGVGLDTIIRCCCNNYQNVVLPFNNISMTSI